MYSSLFYLPVPHSFLLSSDMQELLKKASGVLAASTEKLHKPGKKVGTEKSSTQKNQSLSTDSPVRRVAEILDDSPKVWTVMCFYSFFFLHL